MPTSTAAADALHLAAAAPGPASAVAAAHAAMNADPADTVRYLREPTPTARLGREETLALWHGPRGHYIRGIAALTLCADEDTVAEIAGRDQRKYVVEALHERDYRTPYRGDLFRGQRSEVGTDLARALLASAHVTEDLILELVGVAAEMDEALATHPRLAEWPQVLRALATKDNSTRQHRLVQRPDFVELACDHEDVLDTLLTSNRYGVGDRLASLRGLPQRFYRDLVTSAVATASHTADDELRRAADNPDVPADLFYDVPARKGNLRPLARALGTRFGDNPDAVNLTLRFLGTRPDLTVGELVDTVAGVLTPIST